MTEAIANQAPRYTLGASDQEVERLDRQSASIENATRMLLRASGIAPGMRVLDLGSGLGAVAALVADLVGPQGTVVGIDNNANLLATAAARFASRAQLRFELGDVTRWRDELPFDAVVARLVLFHMVDPLAVLQHHAAQLRQGGLLVALDFDVSASRAEPAIPLVTQTLAWVRAAFESGGAHPTIGTRLAFLLGQAGLAGVQGFGIQSYLSPHDPAGPPCSAAWCTACCRRSWPAAWPRRPRSTSPHCNRASRMRHRPSARWSCRGAGRRLGATALTRLGWIGRAASGG
jgi:ubiquinone/menaquinone biosynthesis C-methylase UbiE